MISCWHESDFYDWLFMFQHKSGDLLNQSESVSHRAPTHSQDSPLKLLRLIQVKSISEMRFSWFQLLPTFLVIDVFKNTFFYWNCILMILMSNSTVNIFLGGHAKMIKHLRTSTKNLIWPNSVCWNNYLSYFFTVAQSVEPSAFYSGGFS